MGLNSLDISWLQVSSKVAQETTLDVEAEAVSSGTEREEVKDKTIRPELNCN